jgi:hypothetical protein
MIKIIKPDIVVLHANWTEVYPDRYPLVMLENTIKELKKLGVPRIVILGPIPVWGDKDSVLTLSGTLFARYKADPLHRIPDRIKPDHEQSMLAAGKLLKALAMKGHVEYIQSYDYFCNKEGCLDRIGSGKSTIVSADNGHLTTFASIWFLGQIQSRLHG